MHLWFYACEDGSPECPYIMGGFGISLHMLTPQSQEQVDQCACEGLSPELVEHSQVPA